MTTSPNPRTPRGTTCPQCGLVHPKCTGHKTGSIQAGDPKPCGANPINGLTVCGAHGGKTQASKAAAKRRLTEAAAQADASALLAHDGLIAVNDPVQTLALLARETLAMKASLAARVNALTELRYEDVKGAEQLRSEVALYERAIDRCARLLKMLADLGYTERMVRLNEEIGSQFVAVMRAVLTELGHDVTPGAPATEVVTRHLRALNPPSNGETA